MRLRATVHGRVQGVGYRMFVADHAGRLGLTGHVRNMRDGTVSVVAEGEEARLLELVRRIERGPAAARVDLVSCTWETDTSDMQSGAFEVRG